MSEHQPTPSAAARLEFTRRAALGGGAAGLAAALLAACGADAAASTTTTTTDLSASVFAQQRTLRFTVVSNATLSPVFTPTQNGVADACELLGCSYQWTGSSKGLVTDMVGAIDNAVSARVDGIATPLTDLTAFNNPVRAALSAGIPVLAYAADVPTNPRLAYIGADALAGGRMMGEQIRALLPQGGEIAVFVATPGSPSLDRRVAGIKQALHGSAITAEYVASGVGASNQAKIISQYVGLHPRFSGFFAADGTSTAAVAAAIQSGGLNQNGVVGGGYDLVPGTQQLLANGVIQFALDEQPYLQGFLAIVQLYLHRASQGLTGVADVNTGTKLIDRHAATAYQKSQSRFEGDEHIPGREVELSRPYSGLRATLSEPQSLKRFILKHSDG